LSEDGATKAFVRHEDIVAGEEENLRNKTGCPISSPGHGGTRGEERLYGLTDRIVDR
jgi:hypothetical protein